MSATTINDVEYVRYSGFVGELLNLGAIEQGDASLMLVEAFWEKERANARDVGIDLDAVVKSRYAELQTAAALGRSMHSRV